MTIRSLERYAALQSHVSVGDADLLGRWLAAARLQSASLHAGLATGR